MFDTISGTSNSATVSYHWTNYTVAVCDRCKGSKRLKVHAPDCIDGVCGVNCESSKYETCDECGGSGASRATLQLLKAV